MSLLNKVNSWVKGQAQSGQNGLALIHACATHMIETRDWTPAARLIVATEKHSEADARIIRFIMGKCLHGVAMKKDDEHKEKLRFVPKDGNWDNAALANTNSIVLDLIQEGKSFRSKAVMDALKGDKEAKAFDMEKYAKAVSAKLKKEGIDMRAFSKVLAVLTMDEVDH